MEQKPVRRNVVPFLVIAVVLMVAIDHFVFSEGRPYINKAREELRIEKIQKQSAEFDNGKQAERPVFDTSFFIPDPDIDIEVHRITLPEDRSLWQENMVYVYARPEWPKIAVIIDDLGDNSRRTRQSVWLPGPLTLSFFPYSKSLKKFSRMAHEHGHEIMLHMPMEPDNADLDPGPIVLKSGQTPAEFEKILNKALDSFKGYVGINNHMGSKLTQDEDAMRRLMAILYDIGLIFVDSRTSGSSVAASIASDYNLPNISRDVFLDHNDSMYSIRESLDELEEIARRKGYAVAIGHPKENTIKALREWIPTLEQKKITLVPVSMLVDIGKAKIRKPSAGLVDNSQLPVPQPE